MLSSFETNMTSSKNVEKIRKIIQGTEDFEYRNEYDRYVPVKKLDVSSLLNAKALRMYNNRKDAASLDDTFTKIIVSFESTDLEEIRKNIAYDLCVLSDSGVWSGGTVLDSLFFEKPRLMYADYDRYATDLSFREEVDLKHALYLGAAYIYTTHSALALSTEYNYTALTCTLDWYDYKGDSIKNSG